jgi:Zn-dependent protease with chaperone function
LADEHQTNGQVLHASLSRGGSSCVLRLAGRKLVARLPSGEVMKMDIRHAELHRGGAEGRQFVYTSAIMGGPTFVSEDAELFRAVNLAWSSDRADAEKRSANPGQRHLSRSQKLVLGVPAAVLALVLLAVLMLGPLVGVTIRFVPRSVDSRIGEEAFPNVLRQVGSGSGAIEQANIVEPVQTVLDRLTAAVPNNPFIFRVAVSRSPMVNALALPGGQLIVTTGMLATLASSEELAAVLAHEMNHVLLRHAMQMTVRASGLRFLVYAVSRDHPIAGIATSVLSAGGLMSMSRDKESQADRRAVHLLAAASIDPKAMVPMLERLLPAEMRLAEGAKESAGSKLVDQFRSHPELKRRIVDVQLEIAGMPPGGAAQPVDVDYGALVAAVQRLAAEPSPDAPRGLPSWDR